MTTRGSICASVACAVVVCAGLVACSSDVPAPLDAGVDAGPDTSVALEWRVVLENLDGALLSVWSPPGTKDVFAVGGPLGNSGFEALVLRYDGARWNRLPAGGASSFWWVAGTSATDVWMVGEKGRIAHYDGANFRPHPEAAGDYTLYGVWPASPTSAYAVGGLAETGKGPQNDVVLRWDGTSWKREALPSEEGRALFKVWGRSDDDVYVVGEAGTLWHKDKGTWAREANQPVIATGTLLTVFGCDDGRVFAVGGRDVLRKKDGVWTRLADAPLFNDVNGGACGKDGTVVLVGLGGLKLRLVQDAWIDEATQKPYTDLHGTFVDAEGTMYGVGGGYLSSAKPGARRNGTLARRGPGVISSTVVP